MKKKKSLNTSIAVLGVPFDLNSSFLRGPSLAPPLIREALHSESANMWTENGIDLGASDVWKVVADLDFLNSEPAFDTIEREVGDFLTQTSKVISLGGDHSITYPILRAYVNNSCYAVAGC